MTNNSARSTFRGLASPTEVARRRELLAAPHMTQLVQYARDLRQSKGFAVPDFDPMDGGTSASMLFLMEKPGPKASASGFISRDNNDSTAQATSQFLAEAGIPRVDTLLWNAIPFWNGTIKVTSQELVAGVVHLADLLDLLPNLRAIVLVGRKAERALDLVSRLGLPVHTSYHPSPKNRAMAREKWNSIPGAWAQAYQAF